MLAGSIFGFMAPTVWIVFFGVLSGCIFCTKWTLARSSRYPSGWVPSACRSLSSLSLSGAAASRHSPSRVQSHNHQVSWLVPDFQVAGGPHPVGDVGQLVGDGPLVVHLEPVARPGAQPLLQKIAQLLDLHPAGGPQLLDQVVQDSGPDWLLVHDVLRLSRGSPKFDQMVKPRGSLDLDSHLSFRLSRMDSGCLSVRSRWYWLSCTRISGSLFWAYFLLDFFLLISFLVLWLFG